jgi:hypothetical protein
MARLKPEFIPPEQLSEDAIDHIIAIGKRQAELMNELEQALEARDHPRVIGVAAKLVGLEEQVREQ